jgi:hypothetical protein
VLGGGGTLHPGQDVAIRKFDVLPGGLDRIMDETQTTRVRLRCLVVVCARVGVVNFVLLRPGQQKNEARRDK